MIATKTGDLKCEVKQVDARLEVRLKEVKYFPEMWVSLFSLNKAIQNGLT